MWMAKPVDCSLVSHVLLANMTTLSQNVTAVGGSSGADGEGVLVLQAIGVKPSESMPLCF